MRTSIRTIQTRMLFWFHFWRLASFIHRRYEFGSFFYDTAELQFVFPQRTGANGLFAYFWSWIVIQYTADHKELEAMLEKMGGMVKDMQEGGNCDELAKLLQEYETMMLPHLKHEEDLGLPLMRAYFTPKEVAPKIQEIISHGPKVNSY